MGMMHKLSGTHVLHFCLGTVSREPFATVFWGDSCMYLSGEDAQPCLHRVVSVSFPSCLTCEQSSICPVIIMVFLKARSDLERYSYVFKMRTQPEGELLFLIFFVFK